jgi:hypothetical protein
MVKTKVANEIWETIFKDRRKVSARESHQEPDICGICGHDKSKAPRNKAGQTVCEATEKHCKKN